ncbi:MAG: PaaI family thioesterase [bacterium]
MKIKIRAPFGKLLEMKVLEAKDGFGKVVMPYRKQFTNPHGLIHGGVICSLADTAGAVALAMKYGDRMYFTAKLEMGFKSAIEDGEIFAEARIIKRKGKFLFCRIEVNDGKKKLLATGSAVYFVPSEK